jgi:hypothetical protein
MNQTDLIILAVYFISIAYAVSQAVNSLENRTVVKVTGTVYEPEGLTEYVDIKFKFKDDDRYKFSEQPKILSTTIVNKSNTASVSVIWDNSAITDYDGRIRRVIRLAPDMQPQDLPKPQVPSVIPPSRSLSADLAPEEVMKSDPDTDKLKPQRPIVDINQLEEAQGKKPKDSKEAEKIQKLKEMYNGFIQMLKPLEFSLYLQLQVTNLVEGAKKDTWGFFRCTFTVAKTPRIEYVPWNPKK